MKVVNIEDFTTTQERQPLTVVWWSGGITSAVATKLALEQRKEDEPLIILTTETGSHHPDHARFQADCERWSGQEITVLRHRRYKDHFECLEHNRFINSPSGAKCTSELKQKVRRQWEKDNNPTVYVWGFECSAKEKNRAVRVQGNQPHVEHRFPLIDAGLTKLDCIRIVQDVGIAVPMMYRLGYNNANCIACPKGGMAYWNKIRIDFPAEFERMAELERSIGKTCLRRNGSPVYLDELDPCAGRGEAPLVQDCGAIGEGCEISRSVARWEEGE